MSGKTPRMTLPTQLVLGELIADPTRRIHGFELCAATGQPSGTVYPILARLEGLGWLESEWEEPEVHVPAGRPRRRYYRLTEDGAAGARIALRAAEASRLKAAARLRAAGA
jgi:PadR family transcriptional regulator, regulatory protein PadR